MRASLTTAVVFALTLVLTPGVRAECPGDVTGDGMVGFLDLTTLLSQWGVCPGCSGDLDGSGSVGFGDLTILLNDWECVSTGPETTLSGFVVNTMTNAPISGATVTVGTSVATTAANGTYSGTFPSGLQTVVIAADNFFDEETTFVLLPNVTQTLNGSLDPVAPVVVTVSVSGSESPGGTASATAIIDILDGSTLSGILWSQVNGADATLTGVTNQTVSVGLGSIGDYKTYLYEVLAEPPISEDQLPPNVPLPEGEFPGGLQNRFELTALNPFVLEETGIDSLLKYGASNTSQEIDLEVVDGLRNFLFGAPGSGGLDLVSLNIQRGRDHGLSDFNSTRVAYGLEAYDSFADLTSDVELQQNLESLYGDINNVDLWVGLMAEDHVDGGSLGETATTIIADQFERLRDGDRLWYENVQSGDELREVDNTTLGDIIERNTNLDSLQANVFFFAPQVSGTVLAAAPANDQPLAAQADSGRGGNGGRNDRGRNDRGPDRSAPTLAGITVELLDRDGNIVDTAVTNRDGKYRFDSFTETGAYQVRLAADNGLEAVEADTWDVVVSDGAATLRGYDFQVIV